MVSFSTTIRNDKLFANVILVNEKFLISVSHLKNYHRLLPYHVEINTMSGNKVYC